VALALALIVAVVALNVPVVEVAATVTDAGTVNEELVLDSVILAPPVGAGWERLTVHVVEAFGPRLAGLHDSEETNTGAARLTIVLAEVLLYVAVTVALALALKVAVVALNVAVVALAATVTDAGMVRAEFEFDRAIPAPPVGAGWVRLTVQVLQAFGPRLAGLHETEVTNTEATRLTVVLAEVLL
jgi:hypothetical protein